MILKTTDAGNTWQQCPRVTTFGLTGVAYIDRNTATVIGINGVILRTTTGGVTWVQGDRRMAPAPSQLELAQNYPNPLNPNTTIKYRIPAKSHVTLTVYNTLGQQVAQLVNEQQQAGYHQVVFRGDELASGVYFYSVKAGEFLATKKLILLR